LFSFAAVIGLPISIVVLIIVAALLVTTEQSALSSSHGLSSGVVVASPIPGGQYAAATHGTTLSLTSGHTDHCQGTLLFGVVSGKEAGHPAQVRYTIATHAGN
jgi:hypothetical protein